MFNIGSDKRNHFRAIRDSADRCHAWRRKKKKIFDKGAAPALPEGVEVLPFMNAVLRPP